MEIIPNQGNDVAKKTNAEEKPNAARKSVFDIQTEESKYPPVRNYYDDAHTKLKSVRPYDNGVDGPMTGKAYNCDENGNIILVGIFSHSTLASQIYQFDTNHDLIRAVFYDKDGKITSDKSYGNNGNTKTVHLYNIKVEDEVANHFLKISPRNAVLSFDKETTYKLTYVHKRDYPYSLDYGIYGSFSPYDDFLIVNVSCDGFPFAEYKYDQEEKLRHATFFATVEINGKKKSEKVKEEDYSIHRGRMDIHWYNNHKDFNVFLPGNISDNENFVIDVKAHYAHPAIIKKAGSIKNLEHPFLINGYKLQKGIMQVRDKVSGRMICEVEFAGEKKSGHRKVWYKNSDQLAEDIVFANDKMIASQRWDIYGTQTEDIQEYGVDEEGHPFPVRGWRKKYIGGQYVTSYFTKKDDKPANEGDKSYITKGTYVPPTVTQLRITDKPVAADYNHNLTLSMFSVEGITDDHDVRNKSRAKQSLKGNLDLQWLTGHGKKRGRGRRIDDEKQNDG